MIHWWHYLCLEGKGRQKWYRMCVGIKAFDGNERVAWWMPHVLLTSRQSLIGKSCALLWVAMMVHNIVLTIWMVQLSTCNSSSGVLNGLDDNVLHDASYLYLCCVVINAGSRLMGSFRCPLHKIHLWKALCCHIMESVLWNWYHAKRP